MAELPPEVQQDLQQLQQMSAQLQQAMQQRMQFEAMAHETKEAVEALEGLPDDATVYRSLGSILVKDKDKASALARLKDEAETLEVRLKRVKGQEEQIREAAEKLQEKIQGALR